MRGTSTSNGSAMSSVSHDAGVSTEPMMLLDQAIAIVRRRAFPIVSAHQEIELLESAAQDSDTDFLKAVATHGLVHSVQSIQIVVEGLKSVGSYIPSRVSPEHFVTADAIMNAVFAGLRGKRISLDQNDHLNKMSRHAISNMESAPLITSLIRERGLCNYDEMLLIIATVKEADNLALAEGAL